MGKASDIVLTKKNFYDNNLFINKKRNLPAIFFDRDGVLIEDCHYISSPDKVKIELGVIDLLQYAKSRNWLIIVITNQSGISRGFFDWKDYDLVTNKFLTLLNSFNLINAIYANGYSETTNINWRKPNPFMILEAQKDFNIDIDKSILIGDRISDLQAATRAGIKNVFHVLSGHGSKERKNILKSSKLIKNNCHAEYFEFHDQGKKSRLSLIKNLKEFPLSML